MLDRVLAALIDALLFAFGGTLWLGGVHLVADRVLNNSIPDPLPVAWSMFPLIALDWFAGGFVVVPLMLYWSALIPVHADRPNEVAFGLIMTFGLYVYGAAAWAYRAAFESSKFQATPGKMMFGLVVCDKDGFRLTFSAALIRTICHVFGPIDIVRLMFQGTSVLLRPAQDWISQCQVRVADDKRTKFSFRLPIGTAGGAALLALTNGGRQFAPWMISVGLLTLTMLLWIGYLHRFVIAAREKGDTSANPTLVTTGNVIALSIICFIQLVALMPLYTIPINIPTSVISAVGGPKYFVNEVLDVRFYQSHITPILAQFAKHLSSTNKAELLAAAGVVFAIYFSIFNGFRHSTKKLSIMTALAFTLLPLAYLFKLSSTCICGCSVALLIGFIALKRLSAPRGQ